MSIYKKFTKAHIEHFKNNKHLITYELLDALRSQGNEGKQIALEILDTPMNEEKYHVDIFGNKISFDGNRMLKGNFCQMELSDIHKEEIKRCYEDIEYFISNYIKIMTKTGVTFPDPRPYQSRLISILTDDNNTDIVALASRQSGKSVTIGLYLCHSVIFKKDINIGICANRGAMAREFLDKLKKMYIELPMWMKIGSVSWNKSYIEFTNGVRVMTDVTSEDSFRGFSCLRYDTKLNFKDAEGNIKNITLKEASELILKEDLLIETPSGYSLFGGFKKTTKEGLSLVLENGKIINCTKDHKISVGKSNTRIFRRADALKVGNKVRGVRISRIVNDTMNDYYDPMFVEKNNMYLVDGIIHHNCHMLVVDEAAFLGSEQNWQTFSDAVFPSQSSLAWKKNILISTANGKNAFYHIMKGAKEGTNGFTPYEADWREIPRYNSDGTIKDPEVFKNEIIAKYGAVYFAQNYACVAGGSIIELNSGKISIEELFNKYSDDSDYAYGIEDEILTKSGFSKFDGIKRTKNSTILFELEDRAIECTLNHTFIVEGKDVIAWVLQKGDYLDTVDGLKKIKSITLGKSQYVYDILETGDHSYIANGIVNHNCSFVGSSYTMISGEKLEEIKPKKPSLIKDGMLKIYHEPIKGHQYVMGVDPSMGISGDFFGVQVVDITNLDMKQVASARLDMEYLKIPDYIHEWCEYYNNAYLIIENNLGSGQSIADMMVNNYEYDNIHYDKSTENNKRKKYPGFRTTVKTRKQILDNMKLFIENGKLEINDEDTYKEFFTFIFTKGKYQADDGCKDDMTMALALCFAPFCNTRNFEDMREITKIIFGENTEGSDTDVVSLLSFGFFDNGIEEEKTDEWGYTMSYEEDSPFG